MSEEAHHPSYTSVFIKLVIAFAVSVVISAYLPGTTGATLIFAIAAYKAYLVLTHFVHLSSEPRFIKILVIGLFVTLAVLYIGLVPDVVVGFALIKEGS